MRRPVATALLLILVIATSVQWGVTLEANVTKARIMEADCQQIARNSSLGIELDAKSQPPRAVVHFSNRTGRDLWFPAEQSPSYRPDERAGTLTIWFGYFDEVYGPYRGRYMVPPMRMVPPDGTLDLEIKSPELVQKLAESGLVPQLLSRVATKQLRESRTRGDQPLQDYLEHSCTIRSPGDARLK